MIGCALTYIHTHILTYIHTPGRTRLSINLAYIHTHTHIHTQDVPASAALQYPQLYTPGREGHLFNMSTLAFWLGNGFAHCVIAFFIPSLTVQTFGAEDLVLYGT